LLGSKETRLVWEKVEGGGSWSEHTPIYHPCVTSPTPVFSFYREGSESQRGYGDAAQTVGDKKPWLFCHFTRD
jgi:hypothetical protein